jgi:hypothetical protein
MRKSYAVARSLGIVSVALCLSIAVSSCSKSGAADDVGAPSAAAAQPTAAAPSKLGDLTPFRRIAADVSAIVNKGDLVAAKARIKDLEVVWDGAEAGLKPRAADDWHVLDKAIDRALATLRADAPRQRDCKAAMEALLGTFDKLGGKA